MFVTDLDAYFKRADVFIWSFTPNFLQEVFNYTQGSFRFTIDPESPLK